MELNMCDLVRKTTQWVVEHADAEVTIDDGAIARLATELAQGDITRFEGPTAFDRDLHFWDADSPELVAQYLLAVDTLNFSSPDGELGYAALAGGLKAAVLEDRGALAAQRLAAVDGPALRALLRWPRELPLEQERVRLLREVGCVLLARYHGQAANLVRAAAGSAARLVGLVAAQLPGFQDHAVYRGRQVFLLKRAQIFAADVYGAFGGTGLGAFHDAASLTCFADYVVPATLRALGVLRYAPGLAAAVDGGRDLPAGGAPEVELRAASVVAVERLRAAVAAARPGAAPLGLALDWWLWEAGEARRGDRGAAPCHRTLTMYY